MLSKQMNSTYYDVIIVGAGPAGLMTARQVARHGVSVALIDARESAERITYHTLGSFAHPKLFELSDACVAATLSSCRLATTSTRFIRKGTAYIWNKRAVHQELARTCMSYGTEILWSSTVTTATLDAQAFRAHITVKTPYGDKKLESAILVDATGAHARIGTMLGIVSSPRTIGIGMEYTVALKKDPRMAHLFLGKRFGDGYGWIFPLSRDTAVVGWAVPDITKRALVKTYLDMIPAKFADGYIDSQPQEHFGGIIPFDGPRKKFVFGNCILVGDAAGHVHPTVGEGYRYIFDSARIASTYIRQALQATSPTPLYLYEQEWNHKYRLRYHTAMYARSLLYAGQYIGMTPNILLRAMRFLPNSVLERQLSGSPRRFYS